MNIRTNLLSVREIWIGLLLLPTTCLCVAATPQGGAGREVQKFSLEAYIEAVTGPNAIDCGRHDRRANDEAAMIKSLKCAVDAAMAGKPFRVIRDEQGIDSQIAHGLLAKTDGKILRFSYDSAPCGGPGCADRFEVRTCPSPTVRLSRGGDAVFPLERFAFVCKD